MGDIWITMFFDMSDIWIAMFCVIVAALYIASVVYRVKNRPHTKPTPIQKPDQSWDRPPGPRRQKKVP